MKRNEIYYFTRDDVEAGNVMAFVMHCTETAMIASNHIAIMTDGDGCCVVAVFATLKQHALLTQIVAAQEASMADAENTPS